MQRKELEKMAQMEDAYWWHVGKRYLVTALIKHFFKDRGDLGILEVGCGTGGLTKELTKFGNVTAFDISSDAVEFCKQNGLKNVFVQDVQALDQTNYVGKFDLILALDVLEHIQDDLLAMEKIRDMLKDGGLFFINVPAHKFLWSEHDEALEHKRRYHSLELTKKLTDSGFKILSKSYFVSFFSPMIVLYRFWGNIFGKSAYPKTSYVMLPKFLNNFMVNLLKLETKFLLSTGLRFGVTLNAVVKKKSRA
jgi:2-polyprenyl-3-methyl-5-hydroxy-6-metoxy-1,4-benzoquinol methylase